MLDLAGLYDKKRSDSINNGNTKWPWCGSIHTEGRACRKFDLMKRGALGRCAGDLASPPSSGPSGWHVYDVP